MPDGAAIVVAFHSPVGYALPRQHLQTTLRRMLATGLPVVCAQVVGLHCEPEPVPEGVKSHVWQSNSTLFYKENLWNLGADASGAEKIVFVDADVSFQRQGWLDDTLSLLDSVDIVQPFSVARWQKRDGTLEEETRHSAAVALAAEKDPYPGTHHPGFAWAMTRKTFDAMEGLWDREAFGGGDTALAYALAKTEHAEGWIARAPSGVTSFWRRPSFQEFRNRVQQAGLRCGVVSGECDHMWHGERVNRGYMTRTSHLAQYEGVEYPLIRRNDKLLVWSNEECNEAARRYFQSRMEDG